MTLQFSGSTLNCTIFWIRTLAIVGLMICTMLIAVNRNLKMYSIKAWNNCGEGISTYHVRLILKFATTAIKFQVDCRGSPPVLLHIRLNHKNDIAPLHQGAISGAVCLFFGLAKNLRHSYSKAWRSLFCNSAWPQKFLENSLKFRQEF